jgi:hypothetical protein
MLMVDPSVVGTFLRTQKDMAAVAPGNSAEADSIAAALEATKQTLRTQLMSPNVVFLPIFADDHWALLTVKKDEAGVRLLEWRDSLTHQESQHCRAAASQILEACFVPAAMESCTLPPRCNSARQDVGSGTCGAFVLFWIEQAVRVHCRGESPCSMKWPLNHIWGLRLHNILASVKAMQDKTKKEVVRAASKAVALKEKAAKFDQGKANTEEAVALARAHLATQTSDTRNAPLFKDMLHDAQLSLRNRHNEGDVGIGCSKCKWLMLCHDGCLKCVLSKAAKHELAKLMHSYCLNPAQMQTAIAQCLLDVSESCAAHLLLDVSESCAAHLQIV